MNRPERMYKIAASTIDLGSPESAGRGIAAIVKFLLKRIDPLSRPKSVFNLRNKIWNLNENEIASKKSPASASLGQSLTFIRTILNGHNASYIRKILTEIVKNL